MLTLSVFMAVLANILSVPPIAIPVTIGSFQSSIHFTQLPIFIAGILAGPTGGLMAGALGGLYMSFIIPQIPFIIGGLAILGCAAGFFARRLRPLFAGILAWLVQAPYVVATDYVWFTLSLQSTPEAIWTFVASIMIVLTIEAVLSSTLTEAIASYLKKTGITL